MKKSGKICAGLLIGTVLASGGLLVGCNNGDGGEPVSSTSDVVGVAAATTSMLASESAVSGAMVGSMNSVGSDIKELIGEAISTTLDGYMDIFDSVIGGNKPVETVIAESDDVNYDHKMTITTTTIDGESREMVLYFNETLTDGETKVDDIDEEERETLLDGKLVLEGGTTLYVKGEKEVESGETEMTFSASFVENNFDNRIEFSQEHNIENGKTEEEYNVAVVIANQTVSEFTFDLEKTPSGKVKVEYEQQIGGATVAFEIEKTAANEITITVEEFFGLEGLEVKVVAETDIETGKIQYKYSIPTLQNYEFDGSNLHF